MSNDNPVNQEPVCAAIPVPTPLFRRQVIKAAGFIFLFFTAYVLLLLLTTALATACVAGGILLLMMLHKVLAVITALVLVAMGIMLLLFLGIYLFGRPGRQRPSRTLLQPAEHPRLFSFISELAGATRTRLPRKVFAIPGVTATALRGAGNLRLGGSQLEIGLGLVNSVNISELKMMLARSLGRVSLPGMQLGSYISGLHQWIYHRLYESDRPHITIRRFGRSYVLRPFSRITIGIADGMQYLLSALFGPVNRACLPVNREMEFYADAAGTQAAGSQTAISALYRAEIGGYCMEHCTQELPRLEAEGLRFRNLYEVQRALIQRYTLRHYLPADTAGLPVITDTYLQTFITSRIQFRNQGASQPGLEERARRCRAIAAPDGGPTASAWELFNNPVRLQEDITAMQYGAAPAFEDIKWYSVPAFITELEQQERQYALPPAFKGYYDNRAFTPLSPDWQQPLTEAEKAANNFDGLYAPAHAVRIKLFFRDRQDLETLEGIAGGQIPVGQFEFDGQTCTAGQAPELLSKLSAAVAEEEAWLHEHDRLAFRFHYTRALEKDGRDAQALLQLYEKVILHQEKAQQLSDTVANIIDCSAMMFGNQPDFPENMDVMAEILKTETDRFRQLFEELWQYQEVVRHWDRELQVMAENYIRSGQPVVPFEELGASVLDQYNNYLALIKKAYLDLVLELYPQMIVHEY
jgi:Zn-dependent protease with chaperone function